MAVVFVPILIFGDHYRIFAVFCGLLAMLAAYEIMNVIRKNRVFPFSFVIVTVLFTGGLYLTAYLAFSGLVPALSLGVYLLAVVFAVMFANVFVSGVHTLDVGDALLTMLYSGFSFLALALIRDQSLMLVIYVLLTAMLTDNFAYLFGTKYGKHKLAPLISPKKSVEGAVSGLVIGGALAALFAIWQNLFAMHWSLTILLTFGLSIVAQIGDLVASKIKRDYGVKDFSKLFPGHGGIMDRFDSWTFTAIGFLVLADVVDLVLLAMVF